MNVNCRYDLRENNHLIPIREKVRIEDAGGIDRGICESVGRIKEEKKKG